MTHENLMQFKFVGTKYLDHANFLSSWVAATSGTLVKGKDSWKYEPELVWSPLVSLPQTIVDFDSNALIFDIGTPIASVALDDDGAYLWRGKAISGPELAEYLEELRYSVTVYLSLDGQRERVGWVPNYLARKLHNELQSWYIATTSVRVEPEYAIELTIKKYARAR